VLARSVVIDLTCHLGRGHGDLLTHSSLTCFHPLAFLLKLESSSGRTTFENTDEKPSTFVKILTEQLEHHSHSAPCPSYATGYQYPSPMPCTAREELDITYRHEACAETQTDPAPSPSVVSSSSNAGLVLKYWKIGTFGSPQRVQHVDYLIPISAHPQAVPLNTPISPYQHSTSGISCHAANKGQIPPSPSASSS
jgi:hypothetical protein